MKRYKLKEEVKKYINWWSMEQDLEAWENIGISLEALEEVPQRVELVGVDAFGSFVLSGYGLISKREDSEFTDQEKDLCEKALNGELFCTVEVYEILSIHNERPPFVLDTDYEWAVNTYLKKNK